MQVAGEAGQRASAITLVKELGFFGLYKVYNVFLILSQISSFSEYFNSIPYVFFSFVFCFYYLVYFWTKTQPCCSPMGSYHQNFVVWNQWWRKVPILATLKTLCHLILCVFFTIFFLVLNISHFSKFKLHSLTRIKFTRTELSQICRKKCFMVC